MATNDKTRFSLLKPVLCSDYETGFQNRFPKFSVFILLLVYKNYLVLTV